MWYRRRYTSYRRRPYYRRYVRRSGYRSGYSSFMRGLAAGKRSARSATPRVVTRKRTTAPKLTLLAKMAATQRAERIVARKAAERALVNEFLKFKDTHEAAPDVEEAIVVEE